MTRRRRHRLRERVTEQYTTPRPRRRAQLRPSLYHEPYIAPRITFESYLRPKRGIPLATSVSRRPITRTVRPSLIRTVRTDTVLPRHLRRRHSPDLVRHADGYLRHLATPWPVFVPPPGDRSLHRAETCARRKQRREVLFAINGLNGRGGAGKPKSSMRC